MRVVLGENQLHVNLARVAYLGAVGINLHAFLDDVVARGDQLFLALDLHDADAAGADLVDFLEKTEGGDRNARFGRRTQNGGAFFDGDGDIVDL